MSASPHEPGPTATVPGLGTLEASPSPEEIMTITASRLLGDHRVVFAGVGTPLLASAVAKRRQAPDLTIVLEGGIVGAELLAGALPISTNEMRAAYGAELLTDITDIFLFAQRGYFHYGFLGAAQVDRFGNVNTSIIGDPHAPTVRLPGSGGANDIISLCNEVLIVTSHERRRFVERVDYVTSPGFLGGGRTREEAGLLSGGPRWVVTELAYLDFEPDGRRMRVVALQEGVDLDMVVARTGFELLVAEDLWTIPAPTAEELAIYRSLTGAGESSGAAAGSAPAAAAGPHTEPARSGERAVEEVRPR